MNILKIKNIVKLEITVITLSEYSGAAHSILCYLKKL